MLEYLTGNKKRALVNLERVAKVVENSNGCTLTYDTGHKERVLVGYDEIARQLKGEKHESNYDISIADPADIDIGSWVRQCSASINVNGANRHNYDHLPER